MTFGPTWLKTVETRVFHSFRTLWGLTPFRTLTAGAPGCSLLSHGGEDDVPVGDRAVVALQQDGAGLAFI